jgi:acetylornithine deacetylase/succinyl-diaminopimelate desuccinylase-like protein
MDSLRNALAHARSNRQRFEGELGTFIRFASVSAQPQHTDDTTKCAAWLADHLRSVGLKEVRVSSTPLHPIVHAEWRHAPPGSLRGCMMAKAGY